MGAASAGRRCWRRSRGCRPRPSTPRFAPIWRRSSPATTRSICRPSPCGARRPRRRRAPTTRPPAGIAALAAGDLDGARRALERARAHAVARPSLDGEADTLFLAAEIALARRDADAAIAALQGLLSLGPSPRDGYDVQVRLGLAEIHRKDLARRRGAPAARGRLRSDAGRAPGPPGRALRRPAAQARSADCARGSAATRSHERRGRQGGRPRRGRRRTSGTRRRIAPIAIFIDPADGNLHAALGRALAATGKSAAAAVAFEHALVFQPADPAALHLTLASLYDTLGERSRAAAHRDAARR